MEIRTYEPGMLEDVAAAYNRAVRAVPHCYPVSTGDFEAELAAVGNSGRADQEVEPEQILTIGSGGAVSGFVHLARQTGEPGAPPEGIVRFLCCARGERSSGQALLEAGESWFRERGMTSVSVFPQGRRYRFYAFDHAFLSDHLDHVHALLGMNGYEKAGGEVFLDRPDFEPVDPAPPGLDVDVAVEWLPGRGRLPGIHVRLRQGERQVGQCRSVSCAEFAHVEEMQDWFFTSWIGIDDGLQGRGLGRFLLARTCQEMHGAGYRHAALSTACDNYRAYLFYTNYGYHFVDWTYAWKRDLR